MELRLLGPVELHADGRVLAPRRPQQQVLLAALAVETARIPSVQTLIDLMRHRGLGGRPGWMRDRGWAR